MENLARMITVLLEGMTATKMQNVSTYHTVSIVFVKKAILEMEWFAPTMYVLPVLIIVMNTQNVQTRRTVSRALAKTAILEMELVAQTNLKA